MLSAACATAAGAAPTLPAHSSVIASTRLAADYYAKTLNPSTLNPKNGWSWATFEQGVQALYGQTGDSKYLNQELAWGNSLHWGVTHSETDPDSLKAVQTYYDLNKISSTASLTAANARMATDLASLPVSQYDWADALFMGLPNWTRYATKTGNAAYLNKMDALFNWTKNEGGTSSRCAGKPAPSAALFDTTEGLWYRDCTAVGVKDPNGKKIFWARGNGWAIAAMAQVIQTLPAGSSHTAKYLSVFKTMAAKLITLQGTDGMWRTSLEDPSLYPTPETSGSALITYALAYGVRSGILPAATYLPAIVKAWHGLTTISLKPSGFVTNCQAVGSAPGPSYTAAAPRTAPTTTSAGTVNTDEPPYCAGAFVLAGSEVSSLTADLAQGHTTTGTSARAGYPVTSATDGNTATWWSATRVPTSASPQYITVNLGAVTPVDSVRIWSVAGYGPKHVSISVSTVSGAPYHAVASANLANSEGPTTVTFARTNARWVRVSATSSYASNTVDIEAFQVFGGHQF